MATVLAADFVGGFIHWLEDAYVREDTPLVGKFVGRPNTIHHHYPRYMTRHSWWQTSWDLFLLSAILVVGAWCFNLLTWQVWLFAILAANANEFHKWEHRTHKENGKILGLIHNVTVTFQNKR
ncbi:MAG: fatty acid desaturase CarF family protein [Limisphaerales bacterium]